MEKVGIVVVTYNRLTLLKEVIESLRCQTYKDSQIVVVNNGSTDDTESWLKKQPDVKTITQANLGGAGGFHTGMKYVAEQGYEYCWIMDDDVICSPTALEELLKAVKVREDIGFVCSRVLGIDGLPMNTPTPAVKTMHKGQYSDVFELVNDHAMVRISMSTFVSVLVPSHIIYEVGLPYKDYFIWGDDSEYTERISVKYPSYVVCRSEVVHKRALQAELSFFTEPDKKRLKNYFFMFRNQAFTRLKNAGIKKKIRHFISVVMESIQLLSRGEFLRLSIYIKSQWSLLTFHPQIEYPEKKEEAFHYSEKS